MLINVGSMMYMSRLMMSYYYDFFLRIPSCSSGFIQDFFAIGSMMYISGEASFIVRVD